MSFATKAAEIRTKIADLRKQLNEESREQFGLLAKDIFDRFPNLVIFTWRQYTPYFNDGEPCSFGVGEWYYMTDEMIEAAKQADPDFDVTELRGWDFDEYGAYVWRSQGDDLSVALSDLQGTFDEDTLLHLFGDHAEIRVTRDGIEVDEADHD